MTKTVTIKDIAQMAGVSSGTVSRVFNNRSNVDEELRQRVLKAASELGYFGLQREHAQMPAQTQTGSGEKGLKEVGFLLSTTRYSHTDALLDSFWAHILHGAEVEAQKSGVKVAYRSMSNLSQNLDTLLSRIYEMRLGGILLVGPERPEVIRLLQEVKVPLVLLDDYLPDFAIDAVVADNLGGAKLIVEHLIHNGHRSIAFIGGQLLPGSRYVNEVYTIQCRALGYRIALEQAGIPLDYDLFESSPTLHAEESYKACKRLLERNASFSAIFCANDPIAVGAAQALYEAGLRVPDDISLVGFDDDMAGSMVPPLTTIGINKEAMGALAIKTLLARMRDPLAPNVLITLPVDLIERVSVRPLS